MDSEPQFLSDRIEAIVDGEKIVIWNHVAVVQEHFVRHNEIESYHRIYEGDGSTGERPDYITPAIDEQLESLDVYPDAEVVDPTGDEVTLL
jgi:hypothetical protein